MRNITEDVVNIISDILGDASHLAVKDSLDISIAAFGIDSLALFRMDHELSKQFGQHINIDQLLDFPSINQIVCLLERSYK